MATIAEQGVAAPPWLPSVVASLDFECRTWRERAVLGRLTCDERMRNVWELLAKLETRPGMTQDDAMRAIFVLAFESAAKALPVTLVRERNLRMQAVGGWANYFVSPLSMNDSIVTVANMPKDPVAKRLQQTLVWWMERVYGGPHLALAQTITEVALDCRTSRMVGRISRKPPARRQPAAGC